MANTFMTLPPLKPGYWWWNTAPIGQDPVWEQKPMPIQSDARIFGYERTEFMARQYRKK